MVDEQSDMANVSGKQLTHLQNLTQTACNTLQKMLYYHTLDLVQGISPRARQGFS
ncbi:hypothetical protein FACS1894184_18110 [Clostridia bacterium]|nr:hypothetical protein FACS1894184_18110 [Clostridia bacterium]